MPIALIAVDLDGTLLTSARVLAPQGARLLRLAIQREVPLPGDRPSPRLGVLRGSSTALGVLRGSSTALGVLREGRPPTERGIYDGWRPAAGRPSPQTGGAERLQTRPMKVQKSPGQRSR